MLRWLAICQCPHRVFWFVSVTLLSHAQMLPTLRCVCWRATLHAGQLGYTKPPAFEHWPPGVCRRRLCHEWNVRGVHSSSVSSGRESDRHHAGVRYRRWISWIHGEHLFLETDFHFTLAWYRMPQEGTSAQGTGPNSSPVTYRTTSGSFLAEMPVRSPRKLYVFIILKTFFWIKVSKNVLFNFENRSSA